MWRYQVYVLLMFFLSPFAFFPHIEGCMTTFADAYRLSASWCPTMMLYDTV